jgi:hypothetical protein
MDYDHCLLKECQHYLSRIIDSHICKKYKFILAKLKNNKILKCKPCINCRSEENKNG